MVGNVVGTEVWVREVIVVGIVVEVERKMETIPNIKLKTRKNIFFKEWIVSWQIGK